MSQILVRDCINMIFLGRNPLMDQNATIGMMSCVINSEHNGQIAIFDVYYNRATKNITFGGDVGQFYEALNLEAVDWFVDERRKRIVIIAKRKTIPEDLYINEKDDQNDGCSDILVLKANSYVPNGKMSRIRSELIEQLKSGVIIIPDDFYIVQQPKNINAHTKIIIINK